MTPLCYPGFLVRTGSLGSWLRYALGTSRRAAQGPVGGCGAAVSRRPRRRVCGDPPLLLPGCRPVTLDGQNEAKISPYDLHYMTVQTHNTTAAAATPMAAAAGIGAVIAVGAVGVVGAVGAVGTMGAMGAPAAPAVPAAPAAPSHCALRLTVLNQTSSEAHKFKLTALFLNRESDKAFFGGWASRKAVAACAGGCNRMCWRL